MQSGLERVAGRFPLLSFLRLYLLAREIALKSSLTGVTLSGSKENWIERCSIDSLLLVARYLGLNANCFVETLQNYEPSLR